jgi:hypothetical protein
MPSSLLQRLAETFLPPGAPAEADDPVTVLRKMGRGGVRFPLTLVRVSFGLDRDQGAIVWPAGAGRRPVWVAPLIRLENVSLAGQPQAEARRDWRHRLLNRLAAAEGAGELAEVLAAGLQAAVWTVEWDRQTHLQHPLAVDPAALEVLDRLPPRRLFVR